jgi:hypothetical protein
MRLASISLTAADAFTSRHYHIRFWEDRVESDGVAGERLPEITEHGRPERLADIFATRATNLTL